MELPAEPRLLILETSGRVGRAALAEGSRLLAERSLDESRRHARDLVPAITEMCAQLGWRLRDLHGVAVNLGPGSYTGLRVGIMTAKTFAWATRTLALGIASFAALARQAPAEADELDVLADAQQQNVYVQRWTRRGGAWTSGELRIALANDWLADLRPGVWVSGPGLAPHEQRVPAANPLVPPALREPQPASLLAIARERIVRGEHDDPLSLEPLYLRPSNAEENWSRMGR